MHVQIQPVQLFGFGNADTLQLRLVHDNLSDAANFHYQLGKMVTPEPTQDDPEPAPYFDGANTAVGNVIVDGAAYSGWNGSNAAVPALVVPRIPGGVTLA